MGVRSLGNLYKDNWGTGFSGNVWDKEMLSPTLSTMQGGGQTTNDYCRSKATRIYG